jgi:hypothetical protein
MSKTLRLAGAFLAMTGMTATTAAQAANCASARDVQAIQVAAVYQELTAAALTCGPAAVANYNRFVVAFRAELRRSDNTLLAMFKRTHGSTRGAREYDSFKTRAIANAERRRIKPGAHEGFCNTVQVVFDAALAPDKPLLEDFVSGVPVHEKNPLDSCEIQVAMNLTGVQAAPDIAPTPRPDRPGEVQASTDAIVPAADTAATPAAAVPAIRPAR